MPYPEHLISPMRQELTALWERSTHELYVSALKQRAQLADGIQ